MIRIIVIQMLELLKENPQEAGSCIFVSSQGIFKQCRNFGLRGNIELLSHLMWQPCPDHSNQKRVRLRIAKGNLTWPGLPVVSWWPQEGDNMSEESTC
jgi:hypothetical protein